MHLPHDPLVSVSLLANAEAGFGGSLGNVLACECVAEGSGLI